MLIITIIAVTCKALWWDNIEDFATEKPRG